MTLTTVTTPTGSRRRRRWVVEFAIVLVVALAVAGLVRTFVAQAFYIPSESMAQTLLPDDWILVSKLGLWFGDVERGDVVVFSDPGGWLDEEPVAPNPLRRGLELVGVAPSSPEGDLVKRVIGVGGDEVACCDAQGRIMVNGQSIVESAVDPRDEPGAAPSGCEQQFAITVPYGYLWVMGDHRAASKDSRCHEGMSAFVPLDHVVGKAVSVFLPVGNWSVIGQPAEYELASPSASPSATSGQSAR